MTVDVERLDHTPNESDLAACRVYTADATGQTETYHISLTNDDTFDDGYLLAGRRAGDGSVTETAWDAARKHFRARGFEVHG